MCTVQLTSTQGPLCVIALASIVCVRFCCLDTGELVTRTSEQAGALQECPPAAPWLCRCFQAACALCAVSAL